MGAIAAKAAAIARHRRVAADLTTTTIYGDVKVPLSIDPTQRRWP